jgi:hypothetical protein
MAVGGKGKPSGTAPTKPEPVKNNTVMSVFDTFSHGFDLPAGVQLNRINQKMHYWETTQSHVEERKAQRELWAKNILKKETQKDVKMQKRFGETERTRKDQMGRHKTKRDALLANYALGLKEDEKETWIEVK